MIKDKQNQLNQLKENYVLKNFLKTIEEKNHELLLKEDKLNESIRRIFKDKKHELEIRTEKLIALNPLEILKRGYSVTKKEQSIVKSCAQIKVGDQIETILKDGKIISKVEEIN